MAWLGQKLAKDWLSLPNYSSLPKKELKREIDKLEADFGGFGIHSGRLETGAGEKDRQVERASLRERMLEVPSIIVTGKLGLLDGTKPPFQPLFDDFKRRRDSFVHCEPGPQPDKWGHIKEVAFHDTGLPVVESTVDLTLEAIRVVWKAVYRREKPHWLPERGPDGRFRKVNFQLAHIE